jgi:hypothetical protein
MAAPTESASHLQRERMAAKIPLPRVLAGDYCATFGEVVKPATDADALHKLFPATFGKPLVNIQAATTPQAVRMLLRTRAASACSGTRCGARA